MALSYTYQWQDSANGSTGWANVAAQTANTYAIGGGELNLYLSCNVTATGTGGATTQRSNVLGPVGAATVASAFQRRDRSRIRVFA